MNAIGSGAARGLAQRLGVTKQAAGKTVDRLVSLGYLVRGTDAVVGRRKILYPASRAPDLMAKSAAILQCLWRAHCAVVGEAAMTMLVDTLKLIGAHEADTDKLPGWLNARPYRETS